jgi:phosphomannomutase/phosphoglucomutase
MNPEIFREYDIRGIVGQDMNDNDVAMIGRGIGSYLQRHGNTDITVGRDCRPSSDLYSQRLVEGLLSTGCNVIDVGICTTPLLYFSIRHLQQEGGVMVTASHNPPEFNGFKVCSGYDTIYGQEIKEIFRIIQKGDFIRGKGRFDTFDVTGPYKDFIEKNITLNRTLRVGVDAGNGTAGEIAVPILKKLGCKVYDLYCKMDGTFPNHEPDPTVLENMQDLIALVKNEALDVGVGFDGDGDRIGVVDEKGNIIFGDQLMVIFAREILSRKPGATFVSEVKCSKTMYDDIEKHGGRAIMWKTGHSLIKKKMKEERAELAGEMSGHMFFADRYFGYDDAIYAMCRLLEILDSSGRRVSELLSDIPKTYSTPEIRIPCPDNMKFDIVQKVTEHFRKDYRIIDIDGVRVLFNDGWGLVRASNTQPVLVLRFEAFTKERVNEIRKLFESTISGFQSQ